MSKIIPVPVEISLGLLGHKGVGSLRNFGSFQIVPSASTRNGTLEIAKWFYLDGEGEVADMNDRLLLNVMPQKLLCHVCVHTFETERDHLILVVSLDDQKWHFPIRARELAEQEVHYQVDVEGEWMTITEAYIGDIIGEEQLMFAEREVIPTIDFSGDATEMYDHLN